MKSKICYDNVNLQKLLRFVLFSLLFDILTYLPTNSICREKSSIFPLIFQIFFLTKN